MPLFTIPLVSLLSAIVLLNLIHRSGSHRSVHIVSLLATISNLAVLLLSVNSRSLFPVEYQFSPLFTLPGMSETLSFSLYADILSIQWILLMTLVSLCLSLLAFLDRSPNLNHHLAVLHLAQFGVSTFILAGSPITGMIGWGVTFSAVLIASKTNRLSSPREPGSYHSNDHDNNDKHPVTSDVSILMFPVFLILAAVFLLYGVTGRLSYANNPDSMAYLVRSLLGTAGNPLVTKVLSLTALFIMFAVLPGMGLAPLTFWLSGTRHMHPTAALLVYSVIMPTGVFMVQRFQWIFQFTHIICIFAVAVGTITLLMAIVGVFTIRSARLTLPWLAAACSAMLLNVHFLAQPAAVTMLLKTLYPGLFVFSLGQFIEFHYRHSAGRSLQSAGLILPFITGAMLITLNPIAIQSFIFTTSAPILVFVILALRIRFASHQTSSDPDPFTSSLGWTAYRFFGFRNLIRYSITWPLQQLADGFLILEFAISFFWSHGLAAIIRSWGRLLWFFDTWCIDGSTRWLKTGRNGELRKTIKHDYIALLIIGTCFLFPLCKDLSPWM